MSATGVTNTTISRKSVDSIEPAMRTTPWQPSSTSIGLDFAENCTYLRSHGMPSCAHNDMQSLFPVDSTIGYNVAVCRIGRQLSEQLQFAHDLDERFSIQIELDLGPSRTAGFFRSIGTLREVMDYAGIAELDIDPDKSLQIEALGDGLDERCDLAFLGEPIRRRTVRVRVMARKQGKPLLLPEEFEE